MKATVVGAGALGGFLGARLIESGAEVTFVARGQTLEALRQNGLSITEENGQISQFDDLRLVEDVTQAPPSDFVVLGMKTWQVSEVLGALPGLLAPDGAVVTTQNGIETAGLCAEAVGADRVIGGAFHLSTTLVERGKISHRGTKNLIVGELVGGRSERAVRIAAGFLPRSESVEQNVTDDINTVLWNKMVGMAISNALGTASRMPLGVFARVPEMLELLQRAALEATQVARAYGARLPEGSEKKYNIEGYKWLDKGMLSCQRDMMDGLPSEFFDQIEAISRLGKIRGVETPIFDVLSTILLPQELLARGKIHF